MNKYIIVTVLVILSFSQRTPAQTGEYYVPSGGSAYSGSSSLSDQWYINLEKYWYYRYKLVNDFMLMGPDAEEVKKDGIDLGGMDAKLLQKIEELTLYVIQQDKRIDELQKKLDERTK